MSWKATAWAKETTGHRSYAQKLLLMMLAEYHNTEQDIAYPSIRELARVCEMPDRTVRWCIKGLENMGFISTAQKGNQYQRTEYVLHFATTQGYVEAVGNPQLYEAAISGAAMVASAGEAAMDSIVQRQGDASEAASPRHTSLHEPLQEPKEYLIEMNPEWVNVFLENKRFKQPTPSWVRASEEDYKDVNLTLIAHSCLEWLETDKKGLRRKGFKGSFETFLVNRRDQKWRDNGTARDNTQTAEDGTGGTKARPTKSTAFAKFRGTPFQRTGPRGEATS